jgi:peroxiredoxin Q/BCP
MLCYYPRSDPKNEVRNLFGVPDSMGGLAPGRVTYIIDPSGTVIHMYNSLFNPAEHLVQSLHAVTQLLLRDLLRTTVPTVP